jgi:MtN3 and saliva related transmembrane protein
MSEIVDNVFGYLGSSLLIISMIPQLYRTYSTKSAKDISPTSLGMQLFTSGIILTYSILIKQIPLICGNVCIILELLLLSYMKWKWRNRVYEMSPNLVEMNRIFPDTQNLNKLLRRKDSVIRNRKRLNDPFDLENGELTNSSTSSSPIISDNESLLSDGENETFKNIIKATDTIILQETSL